MLKPTRVEQTAEGFVVVLSSSSAEEWAGLAYRPDGWPLCPRCGEDELASVVSLSGRLVRKDGSIRQAKPTDEMTCYNCRWNGGVPRRDEAVAWGKLGR